MILQEKECKDEGKGYDFYVNKKEEFNKYLEFFHFIPGNRNPDTKYKKLISQYLENDYLFTTKLKTLITTFCINGNNETTNGRFNELFVKTHGGSKNKSKRSMRKSRKSRKQVRKQVRKSRKSRKQVRKSRKVVRKSRKSRKQVRRNRK